MSYIFFIGEAVSNLDVLHRERRGGAVLTANHFFFQSKIWRGKLFGCASQDRAGMGPFPFFVSDKVKTRTDQSRRDAY